MKMSSSTLLLCFISTMLVGVALGANNSTTNEVPHTWTYDDIPAWGTAYPTCKDGKEQSPINIVTADVVKNPALRPLVFGDGCGVFPGDTVNVTNNGHTIKVVIIPALVADAMKCHITDANDGSVYTLQSFQFHATSEHQVDGQPRTMVAQLVFYNENAPKKYLVVAAQLTNSDAEAASLAEFALGSIPEEAGQTLSFVANTTLFAAAKERAVKQEETPSPGASGAPVTKPRQALTIVGDLITPLIPAEYYRYDGSFTTPPCTEAVKWFVMKAATFISRATTLEFQRVMQKQEKFYSQVGGNIRPVQPLNGRVVEMFAKDVTPAPPPLQTTSTTGGPSSTSTPTTTTAPKKEDSNDDDDDGGFGIGVLIIMILGIALVAGGVIFLVKTQRLQQFEDMLKGAGEKAREMGEKVSKKAKETKDNVVNYDTEERK